VATRDRCPGTHTFSVRRKSRSRLWTNYGEEKKENLQGWLKKWEGAWEKGCGELYLGQRKGDHLSEGSNRMNSQGEELKGGACKASFQQKRIRSS